MRVGVLRLDHEGKHAADLARGQADQRAVVMIMLPRCRGTLSTGTGAPFEQR